MPPQDTPAVPAQPVTTPPPAMPQEPVVTPSVEPTVPEPQAPVEPTPDAGTGMPPAPAA